MKLTSFIGKTLVRTQEINVANEDGGYSGYRLFFEDKSWIDLTTPGFWGNGVELRAFEGDYFDIYFPEEEE